LKDSFEILDLLPERKVKKPAIAFIWFWVIGKVNPDGSDLFFNQRLRD
jgi:hypothetical protein